jgi:hypothetical protein
MWLLGVRILALGLLLRRIAVDGWMVKRGNIPGTRLLVPGLMFGAVFLVANNVIPRSIATLSLILMDVAVLGACFVIARAVGRSAPEHALFGHNIEATLTTFFPAWFARLASSDLAILSNVAAGIREFVSPGRPAARTYVNGTKVGLLAVVVAISIIPDAVLLWLVVPRALWWFALTLDALDIWACAWLLGLYGSMASNPHDLSRQRVVLHSGVLQSVEFDPATIESAQPLGIMTRRQLRPRRGEGSTLLSFGGVPLVEIILNRDAFESNAFRLRQRCVRKILVHSDDPPALCGELVRLAGPGP